MVVLTQLGIEESASADTATAVQRNPGRTETTQATTEPDEWGEASWDQQFISNVDFIAPYLGAEMDVDDIDTWLQLQQLQT